MSNKPKENDEQDEHFGHVDFDNEKQTNSPAFQEYSESGSIVQTATNPQDTEDSYISQNKQSQQVHGQSYEQLMQNKNEADIKAEKLKQKNIDMLAQLEMGVSKTKINKLVIKQDQSDKRISLSNINPLSQSEREAPRVSQTFEQLIQNQKEAKKNENLKDSRKNLPIKEHKQTDQEKQKQIQLLRQFEMGYSITKLKKPRAQAIKLVTQDQKSKNQSLRNTENVTVTSEGDKLLNRDKKVYETEKTQNHQSRGRENKLKDSVLSEFNSSTNSLFTIPNADEQQKVFDELNKKAMSGTNKQENGEKKGNKPKVLSLDKMRNLQGEIDKNHKKSNKGKSEVQEIIQQRKNQKEEKKQSFEKGVENPNRLSSKGLFGGMYKSKKVQQDDMWRNDSSQKQDDHFVDQTCIDPSMYNNNLDEPKIDNFGTESQTDRDIDQMNFNMQRSEARHSFLNRQNNSLLLPNRDNIMDNSEMKLRQTMQGLSRQGDVITKIGDAKIKKYIYTKKELQQITIKYEQDSQRVQQQLDINKSKDKSEKQLYYDEEVEMLRKLRDSKIDQNKLRLTIIKGIDCDFVEFKAENLGVVGQKGIRDETAKGDEIKVTQCNRNKENLRYKIWLIICKIQDLKQKNLDAYDEERSNQIKKLKKEKANTQEYEDSHPKIITADSLFKYYSKIDRGPDKEKELKNDITRADLGNKDFMVPSCYGGTNPLFNILNAYANYDSEIGYSQGMNIVGSWILKFMRIEVDGELVYDEVNAFYVLVHIMKVLDYRNIYDRYLTKTRAHLQIIAEILESGHPEFYEHLQDEVDVDLAPYFTNVIMTMFIANLQDSYPEIARDIFDVFLIDGEKVIFTLLLKFFTLKNDKLLTLEDNDLMKFMKEDMPKECLQENTMPELLDFNDQCEELGLNQ